MTDNKNAAKAYADALFMLAEELSETDKVREDILIVSKVISDNPEYLSVIDSPALPRDERTAMVDAAFGTLNKNLLNLVKILTEKRCAYLLPKVFDGYFAAYDLSRGIERVEAITPIPLTEAQTERLVAKLEKITGKQIIVRNTHDPALLGGMKLRYMGVQLDGSVRSKLDRFAKELSELVI